MHIRPLPRSAGDCTRTDVINRPYALLIPIRWAASVAKSSALLRALAVTSVGLVAAPAAAAEGEPQPPTEVAAGPTGQPMVTTPTGVAESTPTDSPSDFGGSLSLETSIGLGTFVSDPQNASLVVTSLSPSVFYRITPELRLTAGFGLTWYQILDVNTSLPENEILLSDVSIGLSHSRIYNDPDSGFNLSGGLRVGLPTSLASQFQNRLFTLSSSLSASIPVGPVSFSYSLGFAKYFNLTATPTLDCDDFEDSSECLEGRDANPNFGFESERRGAEVYLRGAGANSFAITNSLNISWAIIDELSLSLGFSISNAFGVRAFPQDDLSSENATAGRSQRDRLMSSLALGYTVNKHLSFGASLVTDTSEPFGASGDDFPVIFDFTRASDNITSINLSVTGSL